MSSKNEFDLYAANIEKDACDKLVCICILQNDLRAALMDKIHGEVYVYKNQDNDINDIIDTPAGQFILLIVEDVIDAFNLNTIRSFGWTDIIIFTSVYQPLLDTKRLAEFAPNKRETDITDHVFNNKVHYSIFHRINITKPNNDFEWEVLEKLSKDESIFYKSLSDIQSKSDRTGFDQFLLNLYYSNLISWNLCTISVLTAHIKKQIEELIKMKRELLNDPFNLRLL